MLNASQRQRADDNLSNLSASGEIEAAFAAYWRAILRLEEETAREIIRRRESAHSNKRRTANYLPDLPSQLARTTRHARSTCAKQHRRRFSAGKLLSRLLNVVQ